jgi:hypothetical protein
MLLHQGANQPNNNQASGMRTGAANGLLPLICQSVF